MPELNADIPVLHLRVWIRDEYLYDLDQEKKGLFTPCAIFGVSSIEGFAVGFHAMTLDYGAVIWRLPVSAFVHDAGGQIDHLKDIPEITLDHLELWNAFSSQVAVTSFRHLDGRRCRTILKDGSQHDGHYLFTLDWHGNTYSEYPGEGGHKCLHLLALECGVFALQPNNRILWADPATIPHPYQHVPDYKTNTRVWDVEHDTKWVTSDDDRMFYGVRQDSVVRRMWDTFRESES